MTEGHPPEVFDHREKLRDILLLVAWGGILFLCALSLKSYYLAGLSPLWDNLGYQTDSLRILTNWLDGNWERALKLLYAEMAPAHHLFLATGFLLFGFNPFSPYLASACFGIGCMVAVYLLSQELGAGRRAAFWGAIGISILPNFFYQNFLQTRNDFPAAFFIALSWVLLLRGIKNKSLKLAFLAGVAAGVGTLFKASAPGYVVWGILAFLALLEKYSCLKMKDRMKLAFTFASGAVLACGWHYLPHLDQILGYYATWGKEATAWKVSQYNLQSNWTNYFFYLKNIIYLHLGGKVAAGIALACGVLLIRWVVIRRSIILTGEYSKGLPLIVLIFLAGILPLIFISWREGFASVGDIPILPLLAAGGIAFVSRISLGIVIPRTLLIVLLPISLLVSLSNLQIVEKQFTSKDLEKFSSKTMNTRKELGLGNSPMLQVFSHPIYNIDTLSWLWLINPKTDKGIISRSTDLTQFMFPENGEVIASKFAQQIPLLILSELPGTAIGGEAFHTFNRLHSEINSALDEQGQFIELSSFYLEDHKFPVRLMLNKNHSVLRPEQITADHWLEWEGTVQYFSSRPARFIWRGMPIRKINSFHLVDRDKPTSSIVMQLNQVLPDGRYEYQSELVPPTKKLRTFIVMPESPEPLPPASQADKRRLAFHKVETEVLQND